MLRDAEVLGRIRRHENNAATLVEMKVGFTGNEELATRIEAKHTIKFFLFITALDFTLRDSSE